MQIADNMATRLCFIFFIRVGTLKKRWLVITSADDSSLALSLTFQRSHVVLWNEMDLIIETGRLGEGQDKAPRNLLTLEESFLFCNYRTELTSAVFQCDVLLFIAFEKL
jgi:hypothetical protein